MRKRKRQNISASVRVYKLASTTTQRKTKREYISEFISFKVRRSLGICHGKLDSKSARQCRSKNKGIMKL